MKIEVGKWVRFDTGDIWQAEYDFDTNEDWYDDRKVTKTANTPQELIEVGDIIEYYYINVDGTNTKSMSDFVYELGLKSIYSGVCYGGVKIIITKILTPNADKTVYTLQWEAE